MEIKESSTAPIEGKYRKFEQRLGTFVRKFAIGLLIWLPILFVQFSLIGTLYYSRYPKVSLQSLLFLCITLLPTICVLIVRKLKLKKTTKSIIGKLCALFLPISFLCSIGIFSYSETTDIHNYRNLDAECYANRSILFQELFPAWPHYFVNEKQPNGDLETVYLDAHYYYRFLWYYNAFDIYAEWPLAQEEFDTEVARVTELFESEAAEASNYQYITLQKGSYHCLVYYYGAEPFEKENGSYTYYIFAYDVNSNKVRYIMSTNVEGDEMQPYYLQLNWQ